MAANKRVVSTPIEECLRYDGVLIANNLGEFSGQVDKALSLGHSHDYINMIDTLARQNEWISRARLILDALE